MGDGFKPLIFDDNADPVFNNKKKTRANWRVLGIGPKFVRVGGKIGYHPDDVEAWFNARRVASTSQKSAA